MPFLLRLALAQVRHHRWRWALYGVGVALAVAVPVLTASAAHDARRNEVTHVAGSLGLSDRMIAVSAQESDAADPSKQLARLTSAPVRRQLEFHQLTSRGEDFFLGAADDLRTQTRLTAGSWPSSCTPTRCEAVVVGTGDSPALRQALADLGVVITGTVERTDPLLLGGDFDPGDHRLVLGGDVSTMDRLAALDGFFRHVDWVSRLDAAQVRAIGVPAYVHAVGQVSDAVEPAQLLAPTDALRAADQRGHRAGSRFVVLDALFAALLAGFVVLAGAALRRETDAFAAVLRRRGARPGQIIAVLAMALGAVTLLAGVVGAGVAALATGTTGGLALSAVFAVAALAIAAVTLLIGAGPAARIRTAVELLSVAGLIAAAATGGGSDEVRWLVPPLACLVTGLIAARIAPGVALLDRGRLPVALRIALSGRRLLAPIATGALVAVSLAAITFVGGYRSSIDTSAHDQGAWASPLHSIVSASIAHPTAGVLVGQSADTFPVVRTESTLTPVPGTHVTTALLGVPPAALAASARWSATSGSGLSAAEVARRLSMRLPQTPVVQGLVSLGLTGAAPNVDFTLWLRSSDGRPVSVPLTRRGDTLTGTVPHLLSGLHVAVFQIAETTAHEQQRLHASGEGTTDVRPPSGSVTVAANALGIPPGPVDYRLDGGPKLVPTVDTRRPVPIAVDPKTASLARGGLIRFSSVGEVIGRVVAVLPRLPTTTGRFIVADRDALLAHLDAVVPGQNVTEFWTTDAVDYPTLTTVSQAAVASAQRHDPVVTGTLGLLTLVGALALILLIVALMLFLIGERRDAAGELYAWESDGLRPATLRGVLVLRVAAVLAVAVPVGIVAGLLLARTTTAGYVDGAWGAAIHPPAHSTLGWGWAAALLGAIAAIAIIGILTTRMLRERWPVPQEVDLR